MPANTASDELERYVRFTDEDATLLAAFAPRAAPHLRRIAEEFYERIREHEAAYAVLSDEAQIVRLTGELVHWVEGLFGGVYDRAYFGRAAAIGRAHAGVGVPARYTIAAMAVVRSSLTRIVFEAGGTVAFPTVDALSRLLDLTLATMIEAGDAQPTRRDEAPLAADDPAAVLAHAPLLVVGLGPHGDVVFWNDEAARTTGAAREDAVGAAFGDRFVPPSRRDGAAQALTDSSVASPVEVPILTRAGKERTIRWYRTALPTGDVFLFGIDVTDDAQERERREREKRLASLGTLAAGLAHEIRNPLNGAHLHLTVLDRALGPSPRSAEVAEALETVRAQMQRIGRLVTDFLAYAHPRVPDARPVDVRAVCARALEVTRAAAKEAGVSLVKDLPRAALTIEADGPRLEQALVNLLANAIEACGDRGGTVRMRARREPHHVWVEIEDDGPGLPPGSPPIFDAFFTTKPAGTGLGLSIVHRVAADHAGSVDVESRPGRTCFRLQLPLTQEANR